MILSDERAKKARDNKQARADYEHSRVVSDAEARAIIKEAMCRARRSAFLLEHPEREDEHDRRLRYLEREQERRRRYIRSHL